MKTLIATATASSSALAALAPARAAEGKIAVVAAENFYGDVAQQIGGDRVSVISILSNPDQDPHLFETTPAIVRQIAAAQIVIYNGADYDPWMEKLLTVTPQARPHRDRRRRPRAQEGRRQSAPLVRSADNAGGRQARLPPRFTAADPAHKDEYAARLKTFLASLAPLNEKIAAIRGKYAGAPVTATEPVFGYMAAALKLKMRNERFQLAVMNDTEPSARDVAAFEQRPEDAQGAGAVLQQAGVGQARAASRRPRARRRNSRSSA